MTIRATTPAARPLAIGYCRVSTTQQVEHGASLAAQEDALRAEAERRGWDIDVIIDEGLSAKSLRRPGLQSALERLDRGEAAALLAVRIDRVSRSVADFAGLMERAARRGWSLVMLSPSLDTADASGRFTTHVLSAAAEYERNLTSARVKEGMARRRAEGVHLGRRTALTEAVVARIVAARYDEHLSTRAIAAALTADGVPTATGRLVWGESTVRQVLSSTTAARLLAERDAPTA